MFNRGGRFRRNDDGNGESGRSCVLEGGPTSESRSPILAVLLTVSQMLPYAVSGLLLLAIGAGRVVDAALIAGCTAKAVFELADRSDSRPGENDAECRGKADDGGCVAGSV